MRSKKGHYLKYTSVENRSNEPKYINEKIDWGSTKEEVQQALSPLAKVNRFYHYTQVDLNEYANYEYWTIDYRNYTILIRNLTRLIPIKLLTELRIKSLTNPNDYGGMFAAVQVAIIKLKNVF